MMTELNDMLQKYSNFKSLMSNILFRQNFLGYLILTNNYELEYNALQHFNEQYIDKKYLFILIVTRMLNKESGIYLLTFLNHIKSDHELLILIGNFIITPFFKHAIHNKENNSKTTAGGFKWPFSNRNRKTVPQQKALHVSQNQINPHPFPPKKLNSEKHQTLMEFGIDVVSHGFRIQNASLSGILSKYQLLLQHNEMIELYIIYEKYIKKYIWYYVIKPKLEIFPIKEWFDFTEPDESNNVPSIKFINDNPQLTQGLFNVKGPIKDDYFSSLVYTLMHAPLQYVRNKVVINMMQAKLKAFKGKYDEMKQKVNQEQELKIETMKKKDAEINKFFKTDFTISLSENTGNINPLFTGNESGTHADFLVAT
jgi:hypothetical protein